MTNSIAYQTDTHQQQLDRLRAEVQALREQLRQAQRLATVGTMTAMVAHEFNNILTPIISYAQMAQTNPALTGKAIARAADGGQRASHICKAILGIARNSPAKREQANLRELIEETLSAMAREPRKDSIDLVLDVPSDLQAAVHRVELQQVILNLVINAKAAVMAKALPRKISISANCDGTSINIEVVDNGVGIAPDNLTKIFEPFFTTKKAGDHDHGGSGLGLAICKDILTAMGGGISVRSTPGQGSTFSVTLPVAN